MAAGDPGLYDGTLNLHAAPGHGARRMRLNVALDRGLARIDGLAHVLDDEIGPQLLAVTRTASRIWQVASMPRERRFLGTAVADGLGPAVVTGYLTTQGRVLGDWTLAARDSAHPTAIAEACMGMVLSAASPRLAAGALGNASRSGKTSCLVLHSTRRDGDMGRLMSVLATLSLGSISILPVVESWSMPFGICCTIRCLDSWSMRVGMLMRDLPCILFLGRATQGGMALEQRLAERPDLLRKVLFINLDHDLIHTWRATLSWQLSELATAVRYIVDGQPRPQREEVNASRRLWRGLQHHLRDATPAATASTPLTMADSALVQGLDRLNMLPALEQLLAVVRCGRRVEAVLHAAAPALTVEDRAAVTHAFSLAAAYALGASVPSTELKEAHARARKLRAAAAATFNNSHASARVAACAALCARAAIRMSAGSDVEDDLPRAVEASLASVRDTRDLLREFTLDIAGLETATAASVRGAPLWRNGEPRGWPHDVICHDAFLSYSAAQRDSFTRPFCAAMQDAGWNLWWDDKDLEVGSVLSSSIDRGITLARYAIVVLSRRYFLSKWTIHELQRIRGAHSEGQLAVLPILFDIIPDDLHRLGCGHLAEVVAYVGNDVQAAAARIMQAMRR